MSGRGRARCSRYLRKLSASALVTAQHDRVASYTVLSTVGSLSPQVLGLRTEDAMAHYQQVRDAWGCVRIPDGR